MRFDTVVAVFRPGQRGFLGPYIDRPGNEREEIVVSPDARDQDDDGTATLPTGHDEEEGNGDIAAGSGGVDKRGRKIVGASDEFWTPAYALDLLSPYLPKDKVIFECAWGAGELAKHLRAAGYHVVGRAGMDFFAQQPEHWDIAVTNPPYSRKDQFLERAYSFGKPFAFLMPVEALGGRRVLLYRQHGIELLVPSKRINFCGDDGELPLGAGFPTAWFCRGLLPRQLVFVEADW